MTIVTMEVSGKVIEVNDNDGWMDGWMDGWTDGWMGGWMDGWVGGWVDGWVDGWMDGWVGGWVDGWMDVADFLRKTLEIYGKLFLGKSSKSGVETETICKICQKP